MWMLNPKLLCNKHLVGEHGEIHLHRHIFVKKQSINGRIHPIVQIEPANMQARHNELAEEMIKRGMNHKSPYIQPDIEYLPENMRNAKVNEKYNVDDLAARCPQCRIKLYMKVL